jgi:hypothetical protein
MGNQASFRDVVHKQKDILRTQLEAKLSACGASIVKCIVDGGDHEDLLVSFAQKNEISGRIYLLNSDREQISSDIYKDGINNEFLCKELDKKLFVVEHPSDFYISNTYISHTTLRPSVSAVNVLKNDDEIIGYLVLDIIVRSISNDAASNSNKYLQLKGDPAIRENIFNGTRKQSEMDNKVDDVHAICQEMICELGIFHLKLHYSSSRATFWSYDNPYEYVVHTIDEILTPDICLLYAAKSYPKNAKIPKEKVKEILSKMKNLRYMDDNIYLRAGSINIMNGYIALNFSCDGSHYLEADEFLEIADMEYGT